MAQRFEKLKVLAFIAVIFGPSLSSLAAVCDGNKSTINRRDSLTFTSCYKSIDASPTQNLFEITGTRNAVKINFVVDAAKLAVAAGSCEIPCEEMDNPDSLKCTGTCSYGWPAYLGFDAYKNIVFFYVANSGGDNKNFSVFAMNLSLKNPKLIGKSFGSKLDFIKTDDKHITFRAFQFKQPSKAATYETLEFN